MSNKMKSVAALAMMAVMLLTMMPAAMADSAVYVLHLRPAPTATPAPEVTETPAVTEAPAETTAAAVTWQKDENGNLVLDENGNPIVTETVPAGSDKISTLEDELDPNRTIDIYVSWNGQEPAFGSTATLSAVLNGYGNAQCTIQWQTSKDDASWQNVPGGTGARLNVVVTEENHMDYWRVVVTVADPE